MSGGTIVVRFASDLRLSDNPALYHAVEEGASVVALFVWAPEEEADWPPGGAHRWWLHSTLQALSKDLDEAGLQLILRAGSSPSVLAEVVEATGARAVFWNTRHTPAAKGADATLRRSLEEAGTEVRSYPGYLLHDPDAIETSAGGPYRVFSPFWRKAKDQLHVGEPLPRPSFSGLTPLNDVPGSDELKSFGLTPEARDGVDWASGLREAWTPGEKGAQRALRDFVDNRLIDYVESRDRPDLNGTSRLSPYLHHGELSPRQVWHAVQDWVQNGPMRKAADGFLEEIGWREFSYHVLHHYPHTLTEPLNDKFESFPWREDEEGLRRWQQGKTGFPIVDAGMRQLWDTGWMHNRVRMIVASFLTKDLLVHWHEGARWFWDTLADGDLANNTMGWQWSAGCGADAQPYFRVFNPESQATRHDPRGDYIRAWIPELRSVPDEYIHRPWDAPEAIRDEAGLDASGGYPSPIVDHSRARKRALEAYEGLS